MYPSFFYGRSGGLRGSFKLFIPHKISFRGLYGHNPLSDIITEIFIMQKAF